MNISIKSFICDLTFWLGEETQQRYRPKLHLFYTSPHEGINIENTIHLARSSCQELGASYYSHLYKFESMRFNMTVRRRLANPQAQSFSTKGSNSTTSPDRKHGKSRFF